VRSGATFAAARDRHLGSLDQRDRRFAYELAAGVLRRQAALDRTLELAGHIASLSPDSVQAIKRLMVEGYLDNVIAARRREEAAFAELLPRLAGEAG